MRGRDVPPRKQLSGTVTLDLSSGYTIAVKPANLFQAAKLAKSFPDKPPFDDASRADFERWMKQAEPLITYEIDRGAVAELRDDAKWTVPARDDIAFLCYIAFGSYADIQRLVEVVLADYLP